MPKVKKGRKKRVNRESSLSEDDISFSGRRLDSNAVSSGVLNGSGSQKSRRVVREKREFPLVIAEDEVDTTRPVSWQALNAGPSERTPRRFCCVCGLEALFHCRACYKNKPVSYSRYLCSVKCSRIHADIDCCKPRNWLTW